MLVIRKSNPRCSEAVIPKDFVAQMYERGWLMQRKHWAGLLVMMYVAWWRHQMETFFPLLALCEGNSQVTGQWRGALMFSLICAWTNGWAKHRDAGDMRRHRAYYDVTVMDRPNSAWCSGPKYVPIGISNHHANSLPVQSQCHCNDVIMGAITSQITSLTIVYSTVYSGADQRKHQSSASLAFLRGIHRVRWIPRTNGQ